MDLIKELCREDRGIMSAEKVLNKVSQEYEEWAKALFREKVEMDYRSEMYASHRKGYQEGLEQGRGEGIGQGQKDTIEKLMRYGMEAEQIAEALQIPVKAVLSSS
jgi:predicted transposase/invertase (TIGR01784 family)